MSIRSKGGEGGGESKEIRVLPPKELPQYRPEVNGILVERKDNSLFIGTSNEMGGFESGLVAYLLGPVCSVLIGGVGTILVVIAVALAWPEIRKYGRLDAS